MTSRASTAPRRERTRSGPASSEFVALRGPVWRAPAAAVHGQRLRRGRVIGLAIAKAVVDGVEVTGAVLRDNVRLVANAARRAGRRERLRERLRLLQDGVDIAYSGAAGEVEFDESAT
jgi:hypothetical protein